MTQEQINNTLDFLKEKFDKDLQLAESGIERKMLEMEYSKNVELVKAGNNIFDSDPNDSYYICEGCGSQTMQKFLENNVTQIITLIFLAGMAYAEFRIMQMQIETIEKRLDKKIRIMNGLEGRIDKLEGHE